MIDLTLGDLQASVQDRTAFRAIDDYLVLCDAFLQFIERTNVTRIISPTHPNYSFYQFGSDYGHRVTRPLNTNLFIESSQLIHDEFSGQSIFGINSTFKSNHFLGYSVALNPLDGVYYVDPRPEMFTNERLRTQIADFQTFLIRDLWRLSIV